MQSHQAPTIIWERIKPSWKRDDPAMDDLEPVEVATYAEVDEIVCRAVASGRIVARLQEQRRHPITASVVALADSSAMVVFSRRAVPWTCYRAADTEVATKAARAVLATGVAYNW